MARNVFGAVASVCIALVATPAQAALEVRDSTSLSQHVKNLKESVEQTKLFGEVKELTDEANAVREQIDEGVGLLNDTIGPAASIGISASDWVNDGGKALSCMVPKFEGNIPELDLANVDLCEAQDLLRKELGMPVMEGEDTARGNGEHSFKRFLRSSDGEAEALSPAEISARREVVKGRREAIAQDAIFDTVGAAMDSLKDGSGAQDAVESLNASNNAQTLQERVGHTNKLLSEILVEQKRMRALMSQFILMQASVQLRSEGLEYLLPSSSTWLEKGAGE